jgi:uncharacterized oxidoreductase
LTPRRKLPKGHTLQSDVSDPKAIQLVFEAVTTRWPKLNILVNDAGIIRKINLTVGGIGLAGVNREIETNLVGPMRVIKQFLRNLKARKHAAIVNVSSGLAFIPYPLSRLYCASKAGLQSHQRQGLRTRPTGSDTPLNGIFSANELDTRMVMDAPALAAAAIRGMEKDKLEIRPGLGSILKLLSRLTPEYG